MPFVPSIPAGTKTQEKSLVKSWEIPFTVALAVISNEPLCW